MRPGIDQDDTFLIYQFQTIFQSIATFNQSIWKWYLFEFNIWFCKRNNPQCSSDPTRLHYGIFFTCRPIFFGVLKKRCLISFPSTILLQIVVSFFFSLSPIIILLKIYQIDWFTAHQVCRLFKAGTD